MDQDSTTHSKVTPELELAWELYYPYIIHRLEPRTSMMTLIFFSMLFQVDPLNDGYFECTMADLQQGTSLSERTIQKHVKHMEEVGHVRVERSHGRGSKSRFQFTFHDAALAMLDEREWRPWDPYADSDREWKARPPTKAAKEGRPNRPAGTSLRFRVLQRDNFRCHYCGAAAADGAVLQIDHVHPASKGGPTTLENLVAACQPCNNGKRDRVLAPAGE